MSPSETLCPFIYILTCLAVSMTTMIQGYILIFSRFVFILDVWLWIHWLSNVLHPIWLHLLLHILKDISISPVDYMNILTILLFCFTPLLLACLASCVGLHWVNHDDGKDADHILVLGKIYPHYSGSAWSRLPVGHFRFWELDQHTSPQQRHENDSSKG